MLEYEVTSQENVDRFAKRVAAARVVFYLRAENGAAFCESNEHEDARVLLFFSDEAYARRTRDKSMPDAEVAPIDLFDFLYRWLPGMTKDHVLAGPNWTADLVGLEMQAYPLREAIERQMRPEHLDEYAVRFSKLTAPPNP